MVKFSEAPEESEEKDFSGMDIADFLSFAGGMVRDKNETSLDIGRLNLVKLLTETAMKMFNAFDTGSDGEHEVEKLVLDLAVEYLAAIGLGMLEKGCVLEPKDEFIARMQKVKEEMLKDIGKGVE